MGFFSISNIAFTALGYGVSYVELIATLAGLLSVYYASRANVLTWPTGIINEFGFFIIFFQVNLFADMFLQVYFFIVTIIGWRYWKKNNSALEITRLGVQQRISYLVIAIIGACSLSLVVANLHDFLPSIFTSPASFPFLDSVTTVLSILAMILLAQKKLETWVLWIAVDIISIFLYFQKGILFIGIEYCIFLMIATFGLINWRKQLA